MAVHAPGPATRPTLIWRIRNSLDHEAWESFSTIYTPLIYGHCRRRGLKAEDAKDVTQIVFTRLFQAIRTFEYRPEKGRFRSWLGKVVAHAISRYRKKRREVAWGDTGAESLLDHEEARQEDTAWTEAFNHHIYQTALARIRPHFAEQTWRAFELVWCDNLAPLEVAHQLSLPIDHVYVAKHRVKERLREEIEHLAEDSALCALGCP
jgi:RNA polymerase sigma-70 factor (ECF subfamily)